MTSFLLGRNPTGLRLALRDRLPDGALQAAVLWLMIGLLVVQIVVVWAWGVEPRDRALEDVAVASA
jgi:putative MFS transporter